MNSNHISIEENLLLDRAHVANIGGDNERRGSDDPHGELGDVFRVRLPW